MGYYIDLRNPLFDSLVLFKKFLDYLIPISFIQHVDVISKEFEEDHFRSLMYKGKQDKTTTKSSYFVNGSFVIKITMYK